MGKQTVFQVIGCMSGTSVDGIDLALLETDGLSHVRPLAFETYAYSDAQRSTIKAAFGLKDIQDTRVVAASQAVTEAHIHALKAFHQPADMIGFHGQTIFHAPHEGVTVQIGDAKAISHALNIPVIHDFRTADVKAGGQGAPLLPLYHQARANNVEMPVAILNIGGVANVTWIDKGDILAFDTGPGNALMDDFMLSQTGKRYDDGGDLAAKGRIDEDLLAQWLENMFFQVKPPKSLDRDAFLKCRVEGFNLEDGLATLNAFTAHSIAKAQDYFPNPAKNWYVTGGGRHNKTLMESLNSLVRGVVHSVDSLGWNGDALEAEGFAYLAVRSKLGLPLSVPTTTGCHDPISGGQIALP